MVLRAADRGFEHFDRGRTMSDLDAEYHELQTVGQVVDPSGIDLRPDDRGGIESSHAVPAKSFFVTQPRDLPVLFGHDESWVVGRVTYLARSAAELLVVAEISDDAAELLSNDERRRWYLSPGLMARRGRSDLFGPQLFQAGLLLEVSLTRTRRASTSCRRSGGGDRMPVCRATCRCAGDAPSAEPARRCRPPSTGQA